MQSPVKIKPLSVISLLIKQILPLAIHPRRAIFLQRIIKIQNYNFLYLKVPTRNFYPTFGNLTFIFIRRVVSSEVYVSTLTLKWLMSYIYRAPSKARHFNVVHIWTYVWQQWKPSLSICCTMFQRWISAESFPVSQLCVNTLQATKVTLITDGI